MDGSRQLQKPKKRSKSFANGIIFVSESFCLNKNTMIYHLLARAKLQKTGEKMKNNYIIQSTDFLQIIFCSP